MSGGYYYPQASVILNVLWEDFKLGSKAVNANHSRFPILCRNVRVNINDYSHADTFNCEIDYKNFPFDPRTIRSVGISIFMQDLGSFYGSNNRIAQIEPDEKNAVFQGFADEESISFDDTKRTVRLEGRDFTGLFMDRKYPQGMVNLEKTVDQVIQGLIDELPENIVDEKGVHKIKLDNRVNEKMPILSSFFHDGNKDKAGHHKSVTKEETYWEVIQDIVQKAGLIAYIEIDKLVLSKPRVLFNKKQTTYFVYGNNLSKLEFKRKLGRRKNFNLVVRCANVGGKAVDQAQIPLEATADWSKETGIPAKEVKVEKLGADGKPIDPEHAESAPYIALSITNCKSKDHLIEIGQQLYEELGRQEIEGSFETSDMLAPQFNAEAKHVINGQFDILKLRCGTPITIEITQDDLQKISRLASTDERRNYLMVRGYPEEIASVFAQTIGKMATPFYTKSVDFSMDSEQGFKCKVEFINFIEIENKGYA